MWKFSQNLDLSSIEERIDALESLQNWQDIHESLQSVNLEIGVLRASSEQFTREQDKVARQIVELTLAVGEGIEKVERYERRIKATIQRAQKQLAERGLESPALDAEDRDLRLVDGAGSGERGVPTVPDEVAQSAEQASSVPGVTLEQLQRARGLR